MGRNKLNKSLKRSKSISIKYNDDEYHLVLKKSLENNMKLRTFIRDASLTAMSEQLPKIRLESLAQLRKVGVNLNQVSKTINTISKSNLKFDPELITKKLDDAISEIRNAVNQIVIK